MPRAPVALLAALLLAGCPAAPQGGAAPSTVAQIKARGKLIVATDAGYVPFEVIEPDGTITGFDVELVKAVAADLGVGYELRNTAWDGIVGELKTGKVDAIFSGMSITEDRKKAVAFSEPYFWIGQVVVKRKGDARIQSYRDLDAEGMTVALQQGTTGEFAVERMLPKATRLRFPKTDAACLAVIQEKADAVVFDHPYLMQYVAEKAPERLEGIWEPFTKEPIGAAVRQDSLDLKQAIDATLARLEASGELARLKQRFFGEAAEVGLDATAAGASGETAPAAGGQ